MSTVRIGLVGVALLLCTARAVAFQEQPAGSPAPAAPATPPAAEQPSKPNTNLSAPDAAGNNAGGTEVRIPGLGKLGNLPKMDFGLELLYGAADNKQSEQPQREDGRDELTIRGSVKHKF